MVLVEGVTELNNEMVTFFNDKGIGSLTDDASSTQDVVNSWTANRHKLFVLKDGKNRFT